MAPRPKNASSGDNELGFASHSYLLQQKKSRPAELAPLSLHKPPPLPPKPSPSPSTSLSSGSTSDSSAAMVLLLVLQHCAIVAPLGLVLMWASWPYHIYQQTYHTSGGWVARLSTLFREVGTFGLQFVIPSIYLVCGSYAEVFAFGKVCVCTHVCVCVCVGGWVDH